MDGPGHDASCVLPDGRVLDYWEGGDPQGRGLVYHTGTPGTRVFGRTGHEVAGGLGVRLVSVSRPGYGGSELPPGAPSLLQTGRDTAALAGLLGLSQYAVLGISGGGPFAVATAAADPAGVRALGVAGGIGPWTQLREPAEDASEDELAERALLARLDAGDAAGAWDGFMESAGRELAGLVGLDDVARVDAFFGGNPPTDATRRALWADSLADVVERPDGYVFDNLAWGGGWDVDLREVAAPTVLWYGDADERCPLSYGEWYAAQIATAELVVLPGEDHMQVCADHWTDHVRALLDRWRG